jgi:dienelactone hydrolase
MRKLMAICAVVLLAAPPANAETVEVPAGPLVLTADLAMPAGAGPHPVVLALHGCGGMHAPSGQRLNARHRDWNVRLLAAGFAVLTLDSFAARGQTEVCTLKDNEITPKVRADDVRAALGWLTSRPGIDAKRIVLLGWSHGAMTVLWSVRQGFLEGGNKPAAAIAFYPGCREIAALDGWKPVVPLTMLTGALDDWTPAPPCRDLAQRTGFDHIEYAGAYHGFDAPDTPLRLRTGLVRVAGGQAHVGTHPEARAASITAVMARLKKIAAP